jgi:hypothetical protein
VATARDRQTDVVVVPMRRERDSDASARTYVLRHAEVPLVLIPSGRT